MTQCKCNKCGAEFETEAPSRIQDPICAECLIQERMLSKGSGLPSDFAKVQAELKKEFGQCPSCGNSLIPLQSFKANGVMYCHGCYRDKIEHEWKGGNSKDSTFTVNENSNKNDILTEVYENEEATQEA